MKFLLPLINRNNKKETHTHTHEFRVLDDAGFFLLKLKLKFFYDSLFFSRNNNNNNIFMGPFHLT